jgi:DNA-directed RNA polymerase subunit omega
MEILNSGENVDTKVTSRYTIVIAAAKRARQLLDGAEPLAKAPSDKTVSIAINEMADGKVTILTRKQDAAGRADEPYEEE